MKTTILHSSLTLLLWIAGIGALFTACEETFDHQPGGDAFILSFILNEYEGEINEETGDIIVYIPVTLSPEALTPRILTSTGATINPEPGQEMDFSQPVSFTVTSKDRATSRTYKVAVKHRENSIEKFQVELNGTMYNGLINEANNLITFYFPKTETDLSRLKPIITVPDEATVSPGSGETIDLSPGKEAVYTVTYKGFKNVYRVIAEYATPPLITRIQAGGSEGIIDQANQTITFYFTPGSDISSLTATIEFSNELAFLQRPENHIQGIDFTTSGLELEVFSDIGGSTVYRIIVVFEYAITHFFIEIENRTYQGIIDATDKKITVDIPYFGDPARLSAHVIGNSDEITITPTPGSIQDFTSPVKYTLSANNTVTEYEVQVTKHPVKTGFLGIWDSSTAIGNEDELVAYNWFSQNIQDSEYISFNDIRAGKDLSFYKVLWWHNDQYINMPAIAAEAVPAIKRFYEDGHHLLLTTFATQYISHLNVPFDGLAPDVCGQNSQPVQYPYGWGISINGYEDHEIFRGLDIWNFGDGINRLYLIADNTWRMEKASIWTIGSGSYATISDWRTKTGGLDLGGAEWEADRANMVSMAEFRANNKGNNEGAVVCIGLAAYDWKVDKEGQPDYVANDFHRNIEALTANTLRYLLNK